MHLHSELLTEQERRNFPTNPLLLKDKYPRLFSQGVPHAWKAEDLQESGAMGDASIATAAAGKRIIEDASTSIVELLAEISEFELPKR